MHILLKQFAMLFFPIVALTLANYTDLNVLANLHIARMCHHLFYDLCIFKRLLCFWDYINRWLTTILNLLSYWTYYQTFTWIDTIFVFFVSKSQRNQSRNQITNKFFFQWPGMELLFRCEYDRHIQCEINNDKSSTL